MEKIKNAINEEQNLKPSRPEKLEKSSALHNIISKVKAKLKDIFISPPPEARVFESSETVSPRIEYLARPLQSFQFTEGGRIEMEKILDKYNNENFLLDYENEAGEILLASHLHFKSVNDKIILFCDLAVLGEESVETVEFSSLPEEMQKRLPPDYLNKISMYTLYPPQKLGDKEFSAKYGRHNRRFYFSYTENGEEKNSYFGPQAGVEYPNGENVHKFSPLMQIQEAGKNLWVSRLQQGQQQFLVEIPNLSEPKFKLIEPERFKKIADEQEKKGFEFKLHFETADQKKVEIYGVRKVLNAEKQIEIQVQYQLAGEQVQTKKLADLPTEIQNQIQDQAESILSPYVYDDLGELDGKKFRSKYSPISTYKYNFYEENGEEHPSVFNPRDTISITNEVGETIYFSPLKISMINNEKTYTSICVKDQKAFLVKIEDLNLAKGKILQEIPYEKLFPKTSEVNETSNWRHFPDLNNRENYNNISHNDSDLSSPQAE
ncbi:MAG TPA: hypothetical protein PLQ36_01905 [Candidatus Gracilibacteria bacterium]|nr:hypothetical protein [Candidatus Gracilibacteria bacterium]